MTDAAAGAYAIDDGEDDVLRAAPSGKFTLHVDRHRLRQFLREGLRGQDVFDFAGADADRQRAERAVRGRMRITADDDHSRLRVALFWSDHVDDALAGCTHREERDTEVRGVSAQRVHLLRADGVRDRPLGGGDVVVHRRDGEIGPPDRASVQPETVERLRTRDLVNQVQVDVEQVWFAIGSMNDVTLPDLLSKRLRHECSSPSDVRARLLPGAPHQLSQILGCDTTIWE